MSSIISVAIVDHQMMLWSHRRDYYYFYSFFIQLCSIVHNSSSKNVAAHSDSIIIIRVVSFLLSPLFVDHRMMLFASDVVWYCSTTLIVEQKINLFCDSVLSLVLRRWRAGASTAIFEICSSTKIRIGVNPAVLAG